MELLDPRGIRDKTTIYNNTINSNNHNHNHNTNTNNTDNNDHNTNLPIKSFDFRGFDSSRLLILRDGNYHVRLIL